MSQIRKRGAHVLHTGERGRLTVHRNALDTGMNRRFELIASGLQFCE